MKPIAPTSHPMFVDINGMTVGGEAWPPVDLIINLGDTAQRVMQRNPYLPTLQIDPKHGFSSMIFNNLKLSIEADDLRFSVPCVSKVSFQSLKIGDSSTGMKTVQSVYGMLCERVVDDWPRAISLAVELARQFEKKNPQAQSFSQVVTRYRESELRLISPHFLGTQSKAKLSLLYDEPQANAFFKKLSDQGGYEDLTRSANANALMGLYLGKTGVFWVEITRVFNNGAREKLPKEIRDQMNYQVNFGFDRRLDAPLYPADIGR